MSLILWSMVIVSFLLGVMTTVIFGDALIGIWFVKNWGWKHGRAAACFTCGVMFSGGASLLVWSYVQAMDILLG